MLTLKRVKESRAARNAAASYFSFISIAAVAFLSIPLAVHYLKPEEIGLWTVINQMVSYLLWMDLGIGGATGRKMADAIAQKNQKEINRWWTASRFALMIQGAILIAVGILLSHTALALFRIPPQFSSNAYFLLIGSIIIAGLGFPMKSVPGLMIAQERFHWIPLIQGTVPWVNLSIFAYLLHHGWGIRSYLWGIGCSQLVTWIFFFILIRTSIQPPRWDSEGLCGPRFRSLFGYGLNLSGLALINSVISSLPALLISRAGNIGGLSIVPQYNFTSKGPVMVSNLVQRLGHAFYPRLQRLYVEDQREEFAAKFIQVSILTIGMSLAAGGMVLATTRTLVEVLAGPDFYGGAYMTLWLAVGLISIPFAGLFHNLRQISGSMGRTLLFSALKLGISAAAAIPCYNSFGLAGLAAVFTLAPLVDAVYGYARGAQSCGYSTTILLTRVTAYAVAAFILTTICGALAATSQDLGPMIHLRGRPIHLPSSSEVLWGGTLTAIGLLIMITHSKPAKRGV